VTATGSSKKIAKNLAAKMMLDKLEEVEGQSELTQNTKKKVINVNDNYVKTTASLNTHTEANLERTTQIPQLWEQNTEVKLENPTSVQTAKAADQSFDI